MQKKKFREKKNYADKKEKPDNQNQIEFPDNGAKFDSCRFAIKLI